MITPENYGYHTALQIVTKSEISFCETLLNEIRNDMQIDGVKDALRHRVAMQKELLEDLESEGKGEKTEEEVSKKEEKITAEKMKTILERMSKVIKEANETGGE